MTKIEKVIKDFDDAHTALIDVLIKDNKVSQIFIERMIDRYIKDRRFINEAYGRMYHQQNYLNVLVKYQYYIRINHNV